MPPNYLWYDKDMKLTIILKIQIDLPVTLNTAYTIDTTHITYKMVGMHSLVILYNLVGMLRDCTREGESLADALSDSILRWYNQVLNWFSPGNTLFTMWLMGCDRHIPRQIIYTKLIFVSDNHKKFVINCCVSK